MHAGVRPGVALNRQARNDMLWIREDFLEDPRDHGAIITDEPHEDLKGGAALRPWRRGQNLLRVQKESPVAQGMLQALEPYFRLNEEQGQTYSRGGRKRQILEVA